VYDYNDEEMMEALRPSIEEAQPVQSQELALDYIGACALLASVCLCSARACVRDDGGLEAQHQIKEAQPVQMCSCRSSGWATLRARVLLPSTHVWCVYVRVLLLSACLW